MKNQKETIRKMVSYLNNEEENGGFWLPNIQRPFVWREEQIERLFDSIMRQYPISTLLVWRTKSSIKCRKFIDNYKDSLKLSDFYVPENKKTKLLVLDGQQRLQSLFIALKGSYNGKELYFNILSGDAVAPEDMRYQFKFQYPSEANSNWLKFKDIIFSTENSFSLINRVIRKIGNDIDEVKQERIGQNISQILNQFCQNEFIIYQELDSVDNPEAYQEDDVVEIFIRANSGGTQLGKSDLLFSLLSSSWEDADENIEDLLEHINRPGYSFSRDFILKTCITLLDKGARYNVKKFRDEKVRNEIIQNWDKISAAIRQVQDFLYGQTFLRNDKAVTSYLGLIPLVYFCYHYPKQWNTAKNLDSYILRTLLTGAFGSNPDFLIDRCTRKIRETGDFDVKQIFNVIRESGRNLEITKDTILSQGYKSKYIHLLFNWWYRNFNYTPAYDGNLPQIDHIFPQSRLRKVKEINEVTGRRDIMKYKYGDRDQIANCMLLTAQENGAGGKRDIPPEDWFQDKDEDYLELHLIPRDRELWKIENFDAFIEARKHLILQKFQDIIQKEE